MVEIQPSTKLSYISNQYTPSQQTAQVNSQVNYSVDYPIYILRPSITRLILPKVFFLLPIIFLLYLALYLNLKFAGIEQTPLINLGIIVIIILVACFDLLFEYRKALHTEYNFFRNRLEFLGQSIYFSQMQNIDIKKNLLDKYLHTCTFFVNGNYKLHGIEDSFNLYQYIHSIMGNSNTSQNQTQFNQNQLNVSGGSKQ